MYQLVSVAFQYGSVSVRFFSPVLVNTCVSNVGLFFGPNVNTEILNHCAVESLSRNLQRVVMVTQKFQR